MQMAIVCAYTTTNRMIRAQSNSEKLFILQEQLRVIEDSMSFLDEITEKVNGRQVQYSDACFVVKLNLCTCSRFFAV